MFEAAWNSSWVESLEASKDNRYEVDRCCTSAYRSFQPSYSFQAMVTQALHPVESPKP